MSERLEDIIIPTRKIPVNSFQSGLMALHNPEPIRAVLTFTRNTPTRHQHYHHSSVLS